MAAYRAVLLAAFHHTVPPFQVGGSELELDADLGGYVEISHRFGVQESGAG